MKGKKASFVAIHMYIDDSKDHEIRRNVRLLNRTNRSDAKLTRTLNKNRDFLKEEAKRSRTYDVNLIINEN